jgi:hypothetical protein
VVTDKLLPGKRIRNWRRTHNQSVAVPVSLRAYARSLARTSRHGTSIDRAAVARAWLDNKGIQP